MHGCKANQGTLHHVHLPEYRLFVCDLFSPCYTDNCRITLKVVQASAFNLELTLQEQRQMEQLIRHRQSPIYFLANLVTQSLFGSFVLANLVVTSACLKTGISKYQVAD